MAVEKPLPVPDEHTQPFWDAAREGRLAAPRCDGCATLVLPPRSRCPACLGDAFTWETLSGRGAVHTFTVVRQAPHPAFAEDVPYVIAIVALEEGAHLLSNVVGCDPDAVRCEMPVQVTFEDAAPDVVLPKFTPR